MQKGAIAPLLYTQQARHRISVGISWGERKSKVTVMDKIRKTNQQHDLDLSCFVFDEHGQYIDFVGSMAQDSIDQSGAIYHSGDDATGAGEGDDESISCELLNLPDGATHIIFVTELRSNHVFSQVDSPYYRIVDGMTNKTLFEHPFAAPEGADKQAFVMARVFRDHASPTGWSFGAIHDFPDLAEVDDWGSFLGRYL